MKPESRTLQMLRDAVARQFGVVPKSPTDFGMLAADVFHQTGRTISVSTLKRIWGYVRVEHGVTFSTLSLLCRYVGVTDWDAFQSLPYATDETSGFSDDNLVVASASLPAGTMLRLRWSPDKLCLLRKLTLPSTFLVEQAVNVKLRRNDELIIDSVAVGQRFVATACVRGGRLMGAYTGATDSGIASIEIIPD